MAGIYDNLVEHRSGVATRSRLKKNYRVLHLPVAGAGQLRAFADAMKEKGVSSSSLYLADIVPPFQYGADLVIERVPTDLASSSRVRSVSTASR